MSVRVSDVVGLVESLFTDYHRETLVSKLSSMFNSDPDVLRSYYRALVKFLEMVTIIERTLRNSILHLDDKTHATRLYAAKIFDSEEPNA